MANTSINPIASRAAVPGLSSHTLQARNINIYYRKMPKEILLDGSPVIAR